MKMKKLAVVSAIALMSMGSVYAQVESNEVELATIATGTDTAVGLMTTLSNSIGALFDAGRPLGGGLPGVYEAFTGEGDQFGQPAYILKDGEIQLASDAEILAGEDLLFQKQAPVASVLSNPVDITALAGAVNVASINGGINITGVNVTASGVAATATAAAAGLSTTVIGAMNSSTLDIPKMTVNLSDMTSSTLNIAGLANQGASPTITTQDFGAGQLGLATIGSTILDSTGSTQFDMTGLVSGTETLATSMTDKLQTSNVFNMAVNMAPLIASVNIAATVDSDAWFLNPQTGVVNLAGLQVATTAIGAMNSSITRLGAKLSN